MNRLSPIQPSRRAFTLAETLMAMFLASVLAAICLGTYVTLQRGFVFILTWTELQNNLARVRDCIATDLRNAKAVQIGSESPVQTLTLTIPQAYSSFNTSNLRGGEPNAAMTSGSINPSTRKVVYNGTQTVVYSGVTSGTRGRLIQRTATWSGGSAQRTVASFSNGVSLSYRPVTLAEGSAIGILVSGTTNNLRRPVASGTLQSTISLRAKNL